MVGFVSLGGLIHISEACTQERDKTAKSFLINLRRLMLSGHGTDTLTLDFAAGGCYILSFSLSLKVNCDLIKSDGGTTH